MTARLLPFLLCLVSIIPLHAAALPEITAKSAILVDANTGKVLFSKNDVAQRPVASTQKLLTALIVAESGDLEKNIKIEAIDTNCEPTKINVKPRQCRKHRCVRRQNDAARPQPRRNGLQL